MKRHLIILLATIFLFGCSNQAISKDYLQGNEWIGDFSEITTLFGDDNLPLTINVKFHENTFDYEVDFDELYDIILSNPDNEDFQDNPFSKMMAQSLLEGYLNSSLKYTLEDNILAFSIGEDDPFELELKRTNEGFEAYRYDDTQTEPLKAIFTKK